MSQTTSARNVESRRVSQGARELAQRTRTIEKEKKADKIKGWIQFTKYCSKLNGLTVMQKDDTPGRSLTLLKLTADSPPAIIFSIEVTEGYELTCYNATKVPVFKNSFEKRLTKYSQFKDILFMLENYSRCLKQEATKCLQEIRRLLELATTDDQSNRLDFLSNQLDLIAHKPEDRRYTPAQYRQAIDLCMCFPQALHYAVNEIDS